MFGCNLGHAGFFIHSFIKVANNNDEFLPALADPDEFG
jgi:hypothetical protein